MRSRENCVWGKANVVPILRVLSPDPGHLSCGIPERGTGCSGVGAVVRGKEEIKGSEELLWFEKFE